MAAAPPDPLGDLIPERAESLPLWRRALYLVLGCICLVLGIVGWLVPVVTGIPFYLAGAAFLGASSRTARHGINALDRKCPTRLRRLLRVGRKRSSA